jgi:hypothetical protein
MSHFVLILRLAGMIILYSQVFIFRGILGRALKEQNSDGS